MIACETFRIRLSDQYECFARLWCPQTPIGAVLYLHGIQSHGLWFESSAQHLADAGFAVLLPDRRGSGRNEVDRGHVPSVARLLADSSEYLDELHVRTGLRTAHVLGVSWGAKTALCTQQFCPDRISSVTLVAPGLFPRVDIPLSQKVRVGLSVIATGKALFDIPLGNPRLFTANPERQQFIADDALSLRQVTASFLKVSRGLDQRCLSIGADKPACPIRVFLAGRDQIINNEKTRALVRTLPWPKRDIVEYPEAEHTIEFETNPAPFFNELSEWLIRQAEL